MCWRRDTIKVSTSCLFISSIIILMISIREVEGNSLKRFPCFEKNENWIEETFQPVDYANTKTKVTILLKQRNLSILNEKFEEITNPKNKQWRNWWKY